MAGNSTLYNFDIRLSDSDRGVFEPLTFRAAQHPSETLEYLATRVLAYCLEYTEGLSFSKGGLSDPDEPALLVRDLSGRVTSWIEVGLPEAPRLHRASKAVARVTVYPHKDPHTWLSRIRTLAIHRAEHLEINAIDEGLTAALAARLERRMQFDCVVTGRHLYLAIDNVTLEGDVARLQLHK